MPPSARRRPISSAAPASAATPHGQTLPDIGRVAEAYGLRTEHHRDQTDLRAEVRRVLEPPGPVVCDVASFPTRCAHPRLASVQRPDGSLVSKPLEDLWPFLDRDEFLANMLIPVLEE